MTSRLAGRQVARSEMERRYLTIGFVDLVGATSLSERLDPEELEDVYARIRQVCFDAVSQMRGSLVAPAGDGVMFEFGYPRAHENDAERALASALAIMERLKALDLGPSLATLGRVHARIGMSSGLVLVGLETGRSWTIANSIVGEAANVAHRLQSLAGPDQIVVAQETLESVRDLFDVEPLGRMNLTGLTRPVMAFRLLQRSYGGRRGATRPRRMAAPIVGRDPELAELRKVWDLVTDEGCLRIVQVVGDAGIGKSRLLDEFVRRSVAEERIVTLQCFDALANIPLHPFTNLLFARAGALQDEANPARLDRVSGFLAGLASTSRYDRTTLANCLGLPAEAGEATPLTPRQRKKLEFALFTDLLDEFCSGAPGVLVLEDVHWLDPSSRELLPQIFERLGRQPVLVLLASRSDTFEGAPNVHSLTLDPLSPEDALAVARFLSREHDLSSDALHDVVQACDGIPFFIEQLVVCHANASSSRIAAGGDRCKEVRHGLTLPLAELLFERLDRLPAAKKLMRVISALGQPTGLETIAAVLETPAIKLAKDLELLVGERILACPAVPAAPRPGADPAALAVEYDFRHALLQRACYDSMVSATRTDMHRRICRVLGSHVASGRLVPTSVFAHHLLNAGQFEDAALAWLKGGVESARRSANAEAIDHLTKARGAAARIADRNKATALELKVLAALIAPLVAARGFSAQEVRECCQAGLDLCRPTDEAYIFPFMYARFTSEISSGRIDDALASAELFETVSRAHGYEPGPVISGRLQALALFTMGRPEEAETALRVSIASYQPVRDESIAFLYGANSKVTGQSLLSLLLFYRGQTEEAAELGNQTLRDADEIRHPLSTAIALAYIGAFIPAYCGLTEIVRRHAERMFAFSTEHGLRIFIEYGRFFIAWATHRTQGGGPPLERMSAAVKQLESFSWRLTLPSMLALLGEAYVEAGHCAEALATCERACTLIREGGDRWGRSEVLRVQARAAAGHGFGPDRVRAFCEGALRAAQEGGTPLFEARAIATAIELRGWSDVELDGLCRQHVALAGFLPDIGRIATLLTR